MTTKTKSAKKTGPAATEKARKQAIAEIKQRLEKDGVKGEISEAVSLRDHDSVTLVVLGDAPAPTPPAAPTPAKGKKGGKAPKAAKAPKEKKAKAKKEPKAKKVSGLDAAALVLAKSGRPMNAKDIVSAMAEQKLWKSPGGATPHATIYAAILREIGAKGKESRFKKMDRGLFSAA